MQSYWFSKQSKINIIYNISVITITITMSIILANFGKYAISDCPFISGLFVSFAPHSSHSFWETRLRMLQAMCHLDKAYEINNQRNINDIYTIPETFALRSTINAWTQISSNRTFSIYVMIYGSLRAKFLGIKLNGHIPMYGTHIFVNFVVGYTLDTFWYPATVGGKPNAHKGIIYD